MHSANCMNTYQGEASPIKRRPLRHGRLVERMYVIVLVALLTFFAALNYYLSVNTGVAETSVRCYITIEPDKDEYYYGDTVWLVANIEPFMPGAATPTDLQRDGVWEIVWQRNDHMEDEDSWYDVGEGRAYELTLAEEVAISSFRFCAKMREVELE